MPDITMCNGKDCELREMCFRFKATPSKFYQSWFLNAPIKDKKCDYFWEIKNEDDEQ